MDQKQSRILIVDDVEENLKVLTETLTREGFFPLQAKSGERALQIAKKAQPNLILLDIKMPGMDGYETIKHLKADPLTTTIPVIFISALNQIEDKVKGFQNGAVDYVSKPFQKEEVLARVTTHLRLREAQNQIELEREKSEKLLLNILPEKVAEELKQKGFSEPQSFSDVSVMFSDFIDFTTRSETMSPQILISELNDLFSSFDEIMEKHGCERIKTIGDAYMAVCGMNKKEKDPAVKLVSAARDIISYLEERNKDHNTVWKVRIGIHTGEIVGGIVGTKKYQYDIFGDTVNTASRMESMGEPMKINVSESTWNLSRNDFNFEERRSVDVKGKGLLAMYLL